MFKNKMRFIIRMFARLYVRVGIVHTCGKLLHDRIVSLRGKVSAHKTSLTPPLFIEVYVPSQGNEPTCN